MFEYIPSTNHIVCCSWNFVSPAGSSGTYYIGGFYILGSTSYTPAGGTALGTANSAYGAHAFIVLGATSTNMVVRVTGTSVNEQGTRTASDTEDLDTSGGALNAYYETTKNWIGQISFSLQSGTGVAINDGFCRYWTNRNTNYKLVGLEISGIAGANDSAPNFQLIHHKSTGWTFNSGAPVTPPTPIYNMQTDYDTEYQFIDGEPFAWRRIGLTDVIRGNDGEGLVCVVVTTANRAVESLIWKNGLFTVLG